MNKDIIPFIILIIAAVIVALVGLFVYLSDEDPELKPFNISGHTPVTYEEFFQHNFTFLDGDVISFTVEKYSYYGTPLPQAITLDIRGKRQMEKDYLNFYEPFIVISGNASARLMQSQTYGDTTRYIWLVENLEPNSQYSLQFYGQGECGRYRG